MFLDPLLIRAYYKSDMSFDDFIAVLEGEISRPTTAEEREWIMEEFNPSEMIPPTAYEFGQMAHQRGINKPAHDRNFLDTLTKRIGQDKNIVAMQDWVKGWNDECDSKLKVTHPELYA
jgi:hypothetical protein